MSLKRKRAPQDSGLVYEVEDRGRGELVRQIAQEFHCDVRDLVALNKGEYPGLRASSRLGYHTCLSMPEGAGNDAPVRGGGGGGAAKKKKRKKKGKKPHGNTKKWQSFKEARAHARGLDLTSRAAWKRLGKQRPADIPSNPNVVFKDQGWAGWGDWLGTGHAANGKKQWRSFAAARAFARCLHLPGMRAWHRWCGTHAGERPRDVPACPNETYEGSGWVSWPDFLGNQPGANEECGICLIPFPTSKHAIGSFAKLCGCGHRSHRPCIAKWREAGNDTCQKPMCQAELV